MSLPSADAAAALLRLVGDFAFVYSISADGDRRLEWSSIPFEAFAGRSFEQLQATGGWTQIVHPDDLERVFDAYSRANEGEQTEFDFRFLANERQRWTRFRLAPIRDGSGRVTAVCGVTQDLTLHPNAWDTAQSQMALLHHVIEALPVGVWVTDRDGRVTASNEAGRRLWGGVRFTGLSSEEEYRRFNVRRASDGQTVPVEQSSILRGLQEGISTHSEEIVIDLPDGSKKTLELSMVPMRQDDAVSGAITVMVDVTHRKEIEAQLLQAQRLESVGRLAGGIAHDFNNLLTIIIGSAEMALERGAHDAEAEWKEALAAARRASQLTQQLLAFAGRQPVAPRRIDLSRLVTQVEGAVRLTVGDGIRVHLDLGPAPLLVMIDPGQFEQILLTLAANAREAMPRGGTLRIETRATERVSGESRAAGTTRRWALLQVTDTGIGMAPDVRERIFEPFFTTKEPGKGTGLGLAMCHGIVHQAGGRIEVESLEGTGSTFRIVLPVLDGTAAADARARRRRAPGAAHVILLVEDEPAVAELTKRALEQGGFRVGVAYSGAEALEALRSGSEPVDLLVTDILMPDMLGTTLARRVLADDPDMRIVFLSGYPGSVEPEFAGVPLIAKPFSPKELVRQISDALRV